MDFESYSVLMAVYGYETIMYYLGAHSHMFVLGSGKPMENTAETNRRYPA